MRRAVHWLFTLAVFSPTAALAVQRHGGVEGLVAHQMGHAVFAGGLGYLLFTIYKAEIRSRGWFEFKTFL